MIGTQLDKAVREYSRIDSIIDTHDVCWTLIGFLYKLNISSDNGSGSEDLYRYHAKLVNMWYQLYMERKGS